MISDLPVSDPVRDFVLKTLENDQKKRPSSTQMITQLKSLGESEKKTRKATHAVDVTHWKHLINSDEDWDFAQVWEINAPSSLADSEKSSTYCVVNKFSVTKKSSSSNFLVELI